MSMNLVVLTGRLTREPELKYGKSGVAYLKFSLAVNRMKKEDPTDFINCAAFGKTAELIGEYVKKGNQLGVQGRMQVSSYEVNGEKKNNTEVVVDRIEFLESKGNNNNTVPVKTQKKVESTSDSDNFPF